MPRRSEDPRLTGEQTRFALTRSIWMWWWVGEGCIAIPALRMVMMLFDVKNEKSQSQKNLCSYAVM